jgi:catechol 2,3-dioxygenase-like lactoylglutathione lyase family enzyme
MSETQKPKLVGINHIALEVGNIDEALAFYGRIFEFKLRGRGKGIAFIDMGDQFVALMEGRSQQADDQRHFGLVADDRAAVPDLARSAGAKIIAGTFMDFLDPWDNHIQVVEYKDVQFTKTPAVLASMKLGKLEKTEEARRELAAKGISAE